jgi:hypothetical protein
VSAGAICAGATPIPPERPGQRTVAGSRRRWAWYHHALAVAVMAGTALALLVRPAGRHHTWEVLWAEDSSQFLPHALDDASPAGWLEQFAGYRHLLPRMIASLAALFDVADAARVFALASSVLAAGCLWLLALGLRRWLPAPWMPALVVAVLALTAAPAHDVAANAADLHVFGELALIGLALLRPRTRVGAALAALAALALGLSDPLVLVILPVAAVDALWPRRPPGGWPSRLAVPMAMALAGAVQAWTILAYGGQRHPSAASGPDAAGTARIYTQGVLRDSLYPEVLGHAPTAVLVLAPAALMAVLAAVAVAVGGRRAWRRAAVAAGLNALGLALLVVDTQANHSYVPRYGLPAALLLVSSLLLLAAGPGPVRQLLLVGLAVGGLVIGGLSWSVPTQRADGHLWGPEVLRARSACAAPGTERIVLTTAPGQWRTALWCSWLAHH